MQNLYLISIYKVWNKLTKYIYFLHIKKLLLHALFCLFLKLSKTLRVALSWWKRASSQVLSNVFNISSTTVPVAKDTSYHPIQIPSTSLWVLPHERGYIFEYIFWFITYQSMKLGQLIDKIKGNIFFGNILNDSEEWS